MGGAQQRKLDAQARQKRDELDRGGWRYQPDSGDSDMSCSGWALMALRSVRRDANEAVKTLEKAATISQDDRDRALEEVQKYTDSYSKKVDDLIAAKEKDIMAV